MSLALGLRGMCRCSVTARGGCPQEWVRGVLRFACKVLKDSLRYIAHTTLKVKQCLDSTDLTMSPAAIAAGAVTTTTIRESTACSDTAAGATARARCAARAGARACSARATCAS